MGFKIRRNLANRGINGWFSTLIDRYKLQDHGHCTRVFIHRHIRNFKNKIHYF